MLSRAKIGKIIPLLKKDARRALKMKVRGFPRPYYCSFLLRDTDWFNTWANSGSTYRKRSDRTRNVYCDLRVGSYRYDQVTEGGLGDNDDELESYSHVSAPIDDSDYEGLRLGLWRLSESKYREALTDYSSKESARVSTVDPTRKFRSFVNAPRVVSVKYSRPEAFDFDDWEKFCKKASKWISDLDQISSSWVEFDASQISKIFVSTEGSVVVQHEQIFSLSAVMRNLTKEGLYVEQELVINTGTQKELPDFRAFKKLILEKHEKLLRLTHAKKIHSFSGPVLLMPIPAGLLLHEAIGHRLEGNRLLSPGEGQTFKGQRGKRVINTPITIWDDPTMKKFNGTRCIGSYEYDDEGVKSKETTLVEDGVLKGFLNSRAATHSRHELNGHARNKKAQRPISRMGVTLMSGQNPKSIDELKDMLVDEIRRQDKPFGMVVYDTSGGETDTTAYDFQAFSGEISYAELVYPTGRTVPVKGVNFVGTPLQALNNIIAVSDEVEVDNGFCGAESGFIPVTTISPAVLLSNLELQATEEELVTQYILPRPRM